MSQPKSPKILLIAVILIVIVAFGIVIYLLVKNSKNQIQILSSPSPLSSLSPKISPKTSPSLSPSPSPSPTSSPTKSAENFQVPEGETYLISSKAETNGDGKEETLVVTQTGAGKFHAYVLSVEGQKLYDNPDLGQKPLRIAVQTYDVNDKYVSWMLVFTEQSGNLAFIRWNGTKYEIPQENLGI